MSYFKELEIDNELQESFEYEAHIYFVVRDFATLLQDDPENTLKELENICPDVYEKMLAYECNNKMVMVK